MQPTKPHDDERDAESLGKDDISAWARQVLTIIIPSS